MAIVKGTNEYLAQLAQKTPAQRKAEKKQKLQDALLRRAVKRAQIFRQAALDARKKAAQQVEIMKAVGLVFKGPAQPRKRR